MIEKETGYKLNEGMKKQLKFMSNDKLYVFAKE
jgi:hypothetical protein